MAVLATLCYLQQNGKTLMIFPTGKKDSHYNKKWNGVGGKFKSGETPEECVIREIKEETNLVAKNPQLAGILTFPKMTGGEDWYVFVFVIKEFSGKLKASKEGKLDWFANEEILKLNLWEGDYVFLPWLFAGKFFLGEFVYDDGKLKNHSVTFY